MDNWKVQGGGRGPEIIRTRMNLLNPLILNLKNAPPRCCQPGARGEAAISGWRRGLFSARTSTRLLQRLFHEVGHTSVDFLLKSVFGSEDS